ncbi:MAG: metallophosphoesterase [Ramlibacter sp.]|nr:metallophosphoesterase [Ramlibacter sp.]
MKKHVRLTLAAMAVALGSCGGGGGGSGITVGGSGWNLVAAGDIAQCGSGPASASGAWQTANLVAAALTVAASDAAVLTLGDNAYEDGSSAEFTACYEPTWGRFKSRTLATPGNHDYQTAAATGYFGYFGSAAGAGASGYWRTDRNGWTIISLNSNIDTSAASAQATWLSGELATTQPCLMAVWHHPRFTSAARGDNLFMQDIWSLLRTARADVVLQAHEHHYERFSPMDATGAPDPDGPASFVVGTGGAALSDFSTVHTGSVVRVRSHGVLLMKLAAGRADWAFVNEAGTVLDSGAVTCRSK